MKKILILSVIIASCYACKKDNDEIKGVIVNLFTTDDPTIFKKSVILFDDNSYLIKTPLDTFLLGYPFNRLDGYYDDMIPKLINDGAIKDILVVSDYMKRTRDSIYTLAYYLGTIHFISKRYLRTFTVHTHLLILINP